MILAGRMPVAKMLTKGGRIERHHGGGARGCVDLCAAPLCLTEYTEPEGTSLGFHVPLYDPRYST